MKTLTTITFLLILSSCGMVSRRGEVKPEPKPLTFREERIVCIERFLKQGVSPDSAKNVCDWSFRRD